MHRSFIPLVVLLMLAACTRPDPAAQAAPADAAAPAGAGDVGGEAMFNTPDERARCQGARADSPWDAARLRGATFRAVGQEPGWSVEAVPGLGIHYRGQYGERNIVAPLPAPQHIDGATLYESGTDGGSLSVSLRERPCQDVMSGEAFELTVVVEVDGEVLRGCGRRL